MDKVRESGADIEFEYFLNAQLGNQPDTLKSMLSGRVDIWIGVMPFLSAVTPEVTLFTMPYAFDNIDEVKCVVPKMKAPAADLAGDKYKLLAVVPVGVQDVAAAEPIYKPEDLAGKKVRVAPLPSTMAFFGSVGATAQPLPGAETASALQTGLVEAVDLNPAFVVLTGSHKIAKYHTPTNHNYNIGAYAISMRTWAKLDDAQKAALIKAGDELDFAKQVDELAAFDRQVPAKGAADGMETVTLSAEDNETWRQAGLAIWDKVLADTPGDISTFRAKFDAAKSECK
ncbi:TRAP-type C4-dicarboxylate transport system, substrate-binding protein [Ruegeria marina]|uniref:TRAP-type C4-dicarboxylate transport system, substrate-binding protein n=2 Tax=Ruegeria marina TaxID=639004 RepID=A0A1G6VGB0_9RHOB|nr:TRAP-type C4-dicarboxylate transport system, substrate-binding protein [Ruegeria marina]